MGNYQSRKVAHNAKRYKLLGSVCCNCGADVGDAIEYHHIVPLSGGGNDIMSNLAPLCPDCHSIVIRLYRLAEKEDGQQMEDESVKSMILILWIACLVDMLPVR